MELLKLVRKPLTLTRKLNLIFGVFFLISSTLRILHFGREAFDISGIANDVPVLLTVGIFLLIISRFDGAIIRYSQSILLLGGAICLIFIERDPTNLAPYLLLTFAMVAAHRIQPFGRRTLPFLGGVVVAALTGTVYAGTHYGYRPDQVLNLVNFAVTIFAILYVLFEEEIGYLTRQRDRLNRRAEDLRPFAELGNNVAGLVHDLRGDIAGVYAVAEIERLSGNHDLADKLKAYGERLNKRVDTIMYVATARDRRDVEEIEFKRLVDNAVYYFAGVHRDLKHKILFEVEGDESVVIRASRATVLVVVENVVRNSIEATEGQAIRRVATRFYPNGERVIVQIENTGRPLPFGNGMPINVRTSGYFRRGYSSKESGSGIGMYNVIRALTRLGAEMTIQDIPTGGVVSTISIPIDTAEWLAAKPAAVLSR